MSEEGADDGFFERFGIICYPDLPAWQGVKDIPPEGDYRQSLAEACIRLADKDWPTVLGDQHMIFEEGAQAGFLDWYDQHMAERVANQAARDCADHGFMSKGPGLLLRVTILIHLFRWTCGECENPCVIDLKSLRAAVGIFETYCVPMYGRVCHEFAQVRAQSGAEKIAAMIREKKMDRIRFGDVTKRRARSPREGGCPASAGSPGGHRLAGAPRHGQERPQGRTADRRLAGQPEGAPMIGGEAREVSPMAWRNPSEKPDKPSRRFPRVTGPQDPAAAGSAVSPTKLLGRAHVKKQKALLLLLFV